MTLDLCAHALPERDREAAGILGRALNWWAGADQIEATISYRETPL